jgi:hypothetical protein
MLAQNVKADESTRDKAAPILRKVVCTGTEESFEICDSKTLGLLNTSVGHSNWYGHCKLYGQKLGLWQMAAEAPSGV